MIGKWGNLGMERTMSPKPRFPFVLASPMALELVRVLRPFCDRIAIAGSVRRRQREVGDIELVVIPKKVQHSGLLEGFSTEEDLLVREVERLLLIGYFGKRGALGPSKKFVRHMESGIPVDIFSTDAANWGMTLFVRTGPKEYVQAAMSRFISLGNYGHASGGVTLKDGTEVTCPNEATVFKYLEAEFLPPERRR